MSPVEDKAVRRAYPAPMPKAEAWIREHVGRWVALRDDELVASAISFTELRRQLSSLDDVLVTVIE